MNIKKLFAKSNTVARRRGITAVGLTAVVVALVIFLNLLIGQLPSNILEFDLTDVQLYEVSETSQAYLKSLDKDIDFIILQSADPSDERPSKYVYTYSGYSSRITVTEIDPILYPSVLDKYDGAETNSVVISCADTGKYSIVKFFGYGIDSIVTYEFSTDAGTFVESSFDGEGQLTSAIDYVTGNIRETVYFMTGHEEADFPESANALIVKSNLGVASEPIDLLKKGIPEDCSLLISFKPTMDLANDELAAIREYMQAGGNVMIFADTVGLTNYNALMEEYGMLLLDGYVADPARYFQQYTSYYGYYCVYPRLSNKCDITRSLVNNAMLLYPRAMLTVSPARTSISTTVFLASSEEAMLYSDPNDLMNYTLPEDYYVYAAYAEEKVGDKTSHLTVFSAAGIIDEAVTAGFSSMSNMDIFMNALTNNFEGVSNITIPAKSLQVIYNSVSSYAVWSIIFIGVLPVGVLVTGFVIWMKRRRL